MKLYEGYFDWVVIPEDLPKKNLVKVVAKTINPTYHKNDPRYSVRLFDSEELKEAARSLARRRVGKNHMYLLDNAFVVDAQWNDSTKAVEALLYLPDEEIEKIKKGIVNKVSVEYVWRKEENTPEGVKFEGIVFDRVDLLEGIDAGDNGTMLRLCESIEDNKGILEGEILTEKDEEDKLEEDAESFCKRLGEPFAGYKDFADCVAKNKDKDNPEAYCGYIKHKVEDGKKKEGEESKEDFKLAEAVEEFDKRLGEPMSSDFRKIYNNMIEKYGEEKGKQVFYAWVNKHGYDEAKSLDSQKGKEDKGIMPFPTDKPTIEEVSKVGDTTRPEATNPVGQAPDIKQEPTGTVMFNIGDEDKLKESKEEKKGEEPKKEEVKEQHKQEETKTTETKVEVSKIEQPNIEDLQKMLKEKSDRATELENIIVKLQETITKTDVEKKQAVEKAVKETKEKVIKRIEEILPDANIISKFNLGGQILARDVRRILYEMKEKGE